MMKTFLMLVTVMFVDGAPYRDFLVKSFKIGIEYDHSLPMSAGSERFRHRNNYDPFYITVTATAKNGYVLDYLEVEATADIDADVDFCLIQGKVGSKSMVFQISSNRSDFLSYNFRAYGIKEEDYLKINNVLQIPIQGGNGNGRRLEESFYFILLSTTLPLLRYIY